MFDDLAESESNFPRQNTVLTDFCYTIPSETSAQESLKEDEDGDVEVVRKPCSDCRLHVAVIGALQEQVYTYLWSFSMSNAAKIRTKYQEPMRLVNYAVSWSVGCMCTFNQLLNSHVWHQYLFPQNTLWPRPLAEWEPRYVNQHVTACMYCRAAEATFEWSGFDYIGINVS